MTGNKLVYYNQEDPRWRNQMYSNIRDPGQTIGISGCGPTSFAMVYSSLTGKQMLPPEAAKYSVDHKFRTSENGTAWALFPSIAKAYGLNCKQVFELATVKEALKDGALAIASMKMGHFTRGGHFIVLVGAHDGYVDVYDPNQDNTNYKADGLVNQGVKDDGKVSAKDSVFLSEARSYWVFTAPKEEYKVKVEDANKIIAAYLQPEWKAADAAGDEARKKEAARLADELRKASGQATQN